MKDINNVELQVGDEVLYFKPCSKYSRPATIRRIDETHYINREHGKEYNPILIKIGNGSAWVHNSKLEKIKSV